MAEDSKTKVLNHYWVSPPERSVPSTSLPLTFFDIPYLCSINPQRLFFYEYPYPTQHFLQTILPTLKNSLSLTLQYFFPFAANLICPPKPHKPHILYVDGGAVSFTFVESAADFNHASANNLLDFKDLNPLTPKLPSARDLDDGSRALPLMAIQARVFPYFGFSIGVIFHHAVADGRAFHHFMKSWASICRTGGLLEEPEPLHSRADVEDKYGLEQNFLEWWWNWGSKQSMSNNPSDQIFNDIFQTTIILRQTQIQNLKNWVSYQYKIEFEAIHISTFVEVCSLMWVCLLKSEDSMINYSSDDKLCYFLFSADCRNRYGFSSIPLRYFGNCLAFCYVPHKRKELVGEFGFVQALNAIGSKIKELDGAAFTGAEEWMQIGKEIMDLEQKLMIVGGSSKFGVYRTNFGWGKLKKTEVVHVDIPGNISLADSKDEEGGIEVGLSLPRVQMNNFDVILKQYLDLSKSIVSLPKANEF